MKLSDKWYLGMEQIEYSERTQNPDNALTNTT